MSEYKMVDTGAAWCTTCGVVYGPAHANRYGPSHHIEELYRKVPDVCGAPFPKFGVDLTCDQTRSHSVHKAEWTAFGRKHLVTWDETPAGVTDDA